MKILLLMVVVQSLNLVIFAWLDRVAFVQILALRQQLCVHQRKLKPPKLSTLVHKYGNQNLSRLPLMRRAVFFLEVLSGHRV
jgi:hypothetical protein